MQLANSTHDLPFICQRHDSIAIMGTAFVMPSQRHGTVILLRPNLSAFGVVRLGNMYKMRLNEIN